MDMEAFRKLTWPEEFGDSPPPLPLELQKAVREPSAQNAEPRIFDELEEWEEDTKVLPDGTSSTFIMQPPMELEAGKADQLITFCGVKVAEVGKAGLTKAQLCQTISRLSKVELTKETAVWHGRPADPQCKSGAAWKQFPPLSTMELQGVIPKKKRLKLQPEKRVAAQKAATRKAKKTQSRGLNAGQSMTGVRSQVFTGHGKMFIKTRPAAEKPQSGDACGNAVALGAKKIKGGYLGEGQKQSAFGTDSAADEKRASRKRKVSFQSPSSMVSEDQVSSTMPLGPAPGSGKPGASTGDKRFGARRRRHEHEHGTRSSKDDTALAEHERDAGHSRSRGCSDKDKRVSQGKRGPERESRKEPRKNRENSP
ncbi:unnamed protein product, partial [Chrysoparadoxa australica]